MRLLLCPQDLELADKSKELGQQAGIIEYINRLSSNAAETAAAAKEVVVAEDGVRASAIPDSEERQEVSCL